MAMLINIAKMTTLCDRITAQTIIMIMTLLKDYFYKCCEGIIMFCLD